MQPRSPAEITIMKLSYIKRRKPSAIVSPIERRTPYSQTASLMFCVVDVNSMKKDIVRAIAPMTAIKTSKMTWNDTTLSRMSFSCKTII